MTTQRPYEVGDKVHCDLGSSSVVGIVKQVYPFTRALLITVDGDTRDIEIGSMWTVRNGSKGAS